jgi:hypothetical protein
LVTPLPGAAVISPAIWLSGTDEPWHSLPRSAFTCRCRRTCVTAGRFTVTLTTWAFSVLNLASQLNTISTNRAGADANRVSLANTTAHLLIPRLRYHRDAFDLDQGGFFKSRGSQCQYRQRQSPYNLRAEPEHRPTSVFSIDFFLPRWPS